MEIFKIIRLITIKKIVKGKNLKNKCFHNFLYLFIILVESYIYLYFFLNHQNFNFFKTFHIDSIAIYIPSTTNYIGFISKLKTFFIISIDN